ARMWRLKSISDKMDDTGTIQATLASSG
ncbi:uncharacterized protein METZ01_LOCUS200386, partial [marine metagenome]